MAGAKFSLLGFCVLRAVQNSPCLCILGENSRFSVCWESFVPGWVCGAACWESFVPGWAFSDAVGFTVMTSLCSVRDKVRPVRSDVNANAKKFAQRGKSGLKIAVYGVLGEFFCENAAGVPLRGELCRARGRMRLVLGECCRAQGVGVFFSVTGASRWF